MARKPERAPQQGQEELLPEVVTLAIGRTTDKRHALLWLRTRGEEVTGRELVEVQPWAEVVERSWRDHAWQRFFRQEEAPAAERLARARAMAPLRGEDVAECVGLGVVRRGKQLAVVYVETEGARVSAFEVLAAEGSLMSAWDSLEREALARLLEAERYERARASAGWWGKAKKAGGAK